MSVERVEESGGRLPVGASTRPGSKRLVVIGAGPAGLTTAYEAIRLGLPAVVLEKSGDVGGLARTAAYKGFHFDMGGQDRKSTRLNSSHSQISYAVFCLKKKKK